MISKTILIRINPASNGYSVVLTNHNVPGSENRQEVVKSTFEEVQTSITEFLGGVAATDAAQAAAAERQAAEKRDAAAKAEAPVAEPAPAAEAAPAPAAP